MLLWVIDMNQLGGCLHPLKKGSIQAFRPPTQTQSWYKNIKRYIFSNLSFRNHSLLGGRLSSASVSAPLWQKKKKIQVISLRREQLSPHESSVLEVTSWKVTTGGQPAARSELWRQFLFVERTPATNSRKGMILLTLAVVVFVLLFFPPVLFHCCWSLNKTKSLQTCEWFCDAELDHSGALRKKR